MSEIMGTFIYKDEEIVVYRDSSYKFPDYKTYNIKPSKFKFENNQLIIQHCNRHDAVYLSSEDMFYRELKRIIDDYEFESVFLE